MADAEHEPRPGPATGPASRPEVEALLASLRDGGAHTLDDLAAASHLSRFHLSRLLKRHLGFPLRDFLAAVKVDRGIDGLVSGHEVTRSQLEAGHESPASYHHAFVRHTGLAPSRYRASMQQLASHLLRHQDDATPLAVLHRTFDAASHPQRHPLTLRVEGAQAHAALFVALHHEPIVRGEPDLGIALLGTSDYTVTHLPDGSYYAMVVEVPPSSSLTSYFRMDANRRQLDRIPLTFPLAAPRTVTLTLRDLVPSDPPITVNLPRLFMAGLLGHVDVEVRNPRQAGGDDSH